MESGVTPQPPSPMTTLIETLEAAKRLQAALGSLEPDLAMHLADIRTVIAPILAQPAPFKVGDRVRLKPGEEHYTFAPGDTFIIDRIDGDGDLWIGDHCVHAVKVEPVRFIGPLDEPAPDKPEPVVDAVELKAKAWELFCSYPGMSASVAFDEAINFLTEAARREKEPT